MTALEMIAAERARQIAVEGWDIGHDDEHEDGQLADAAACYAAMPDSRHVKPLGSFDTVSLTPDPDRCFRSPVLWPWDSCWWKPTPNDRVRELVKAGALIVAEIERVQRAAPSASPVSGGGR